MKIQIFHRWKKPHQSKQKLQKRQMQQNYEKPLNQNQAKKNR